MRILLENRHYCRIRSRAQRAGTDGGAVRVHVCKVLRGQGYNLSRIRAVGRCRRTTGEVLDNSVPQVIAGYNSRNLEVLSAALAFVRGKEENAVLLYRPACRYTERVANQVRRLVRKSRLQLIVLVEPVIRFAYVRSVVFIGRAMKTVRTALGQ